MGPCKLLSFLQVNTSARAMDVEQLGLWEATVRSQPEAVVRDVAASHALLEGGASSQAIAVAKLKAAPFSFPHRHTAHSTQQRGARKTTPLVVLGSSCCNRNALRVLVLSSGQFWFYALIYLFLLIQK